MNLKSVLTNLKLVEDDSPPASLHSMPPADFSAMQQQPSQPSSFVNTTPGFTFSRNVSSDPELVKRLKTSVFGDSPILGQFMQNVETMRLSFPNDEVTAMKAALAFTRVKKESLLDEISHTVAASLLHAKGGMDSERDNVSKGAVGKLQTQLSTTNDDIRNLESQAAQIQQTLSSKHAEVNDLQGKIQTTQADLQHQDDIVTASFTEVSQYVALLQQTLTRL